MQLGGVGFEVQAQYLWSAMMEQTHSEMARPFTKMSLRITVRNKPSAVSRSAALQAMMLSWSRGTSSSL